MKARYIFSTMAALAVCQALMAQQKLEETLYVEGEYVPAVVRQDKIHLLPQKVGFEMPAVRPATATDLLTGNYAPRYFTLQPPVWRGMPAEYYHRGYLSAALGSYLNSDLSAGYRVIDNADTRARIWLQHNSTSLFHPRSGELGRDWKRYRYDEQIGFNFRHNTGDAGTLSAALKYHLGLFNYYGVASRSEQNAKAPTQTLNDAFLQLGWQSAGKNGWDFGVSAEGGIFSYRRFYTVADFVWRGMKGQSEVQAGVAGHIRRIFNGAHSLGIDVDFVNLSYNKAIEQGRSRSLQNISLTAAYSYTGERFSARLGVRADITFGAGKGIFEAMPELSSSKVHVAPSASVSYNGGAWNATVSAVGGLKMQSLRNGCQLDYYRQPLMEYVQPAFVPVQATARLEYKPDTRFRAGVDFSYAMVRHLYQGGWYMADLSASNGSSAAVSNYCNLSGYSIGLDATWQPVDALSLYGRGTWQPQRSGSTTGFFNGYDRPRWIVDAQATIKPIGNLAVSLGYSYRGVRSIFKRYDNTTNSYGTRLPDICNLKLGARYKVNGSLSVFGKADNLLGRRAMLLPCMPDEGFNFLLGADVVF